MAQFLGPLGSGDYHLVQYRFLFLQLRELILEVRIFFLLVHHPQLQVAVQRFHQRPRCVHDLIVIIFYLILHCFQLLPEQLDQLVILLEILVSLAHEILTMISGCTSTIPVWPTAFVVFEFCYFDVESIGVWLYDYFYPPELYYFYFKPRQGREGLSGNQKGDIFG